VEKKNMKEVKKLIDLGKEKGYLTYDDVNDMLPAEVVSPDQIDDVMSIFGEMDIEVVDSNQRVSLGGAGEDLAPELMLSNLTPRYVGLSFRVLRVGILHTGWRIRSRPERPRLPAFQSGSREACALRFRR
jgi:hypothetical protein